MAGQCGLNWQQKPPLSYPSSQFVEDQAAKSCCSEGIFPLLSDLIASNICAKLGMSTSVSNAQIKVS